MDMVEAWQVIITAAIAGFGGAWLYRQVEAQKVVAGGLIKPTGSLFKAGVKSRLPYL